MNKEFIQFHDNKLSIFNLSNISRISMGKDEYDNNYVIEVRQINDIEAYCILIYLSENERNKDYYRILNILGLKDK